MSNHTFTVRLDTGYEDEKQAWDKLKRLQRKTHLSYNRIVTDAVNAYETDFVHLAPEDEAQLVQRMTDSACLSGRVLCRGGIHGDNITCFSGRNQKQCNSARTHGCR